MKTSAPAVLESHQDAAYWQRGRLIVEISGRDAGSMRLDLDVAEFDTAEDAAEHVKLVIPGEYSPLNATDVVGENGRFVISFFSADIANAGHLPAQAIASWDVNGSREHMKCVSVVSAKQVELDEGADASNIPDAGSNAAYPMIVGLMAMAGLAVVLGFVFNLLTQAT